MAKIKVPDRSDHQNVKEKLSVTAGVYKGPIDSLYMPRHMADTHEGCGNDMSAADGGYLPLCTLCTVAHSRRQEQNRNFM